MRLQRIADWLRNNMKAPRHSQAVPAPNSPAIDIVEMLKMFAKKPTKPSRLIIYMDRVYYEKIKPVVDSRMETEPNKRLRVSIQHEIATKMLEAEAPEFLKDIDTERDVRHEEAMRAYNATTDIGDGATLSPEERHRCAPLSSSTSTRL